MTMNWKRNSKKYIAGILTIALAVGAGQSYGSMEVSAQERTLPGIEKLVQDTVASSDGTFHILEIVPSKENATIGYLAGGEEPVSEGRKLSEMPSATERQTAMDSLDAAKFPTTGPVTFSAYSESTGASRTEDVRGRFVFRQDGSGRYNYQQIDAVYREIANGETVAAGERYNRYSALEAAGDSNRDAKSVTPVFSHRSTGGSNGLETTIINGSDSARGYAQGLYAISETDLAAIDKTSFQAKDYVDRTIYQKIGTGETAVYTYLGQIVYGTDAALPDGLKTTSRGVSGNDAGTAVQARTISGGDAIAAYSAGDITQNLYILDHAQPDSAQLLAKWDDVSKGFTGTPISAKDRNTREVFGDYLDIYDMTQAVEDGATRPVYYESRVIKLHLDQNTLALIDATYDALEQQSDAATIEKSKKMLGQMESVLGAESTIQSLCEDIVNHYEKYRANLLTGKAMIVAYSRPIAMKIYRKLLELRPTWNEKIGVVMTGGNNDPEDWKEIIGTKSHKEELARKFKDNDDPMKIAIVVDMWLTCAFTGYDVCLQANARIQSDAGHRACQPRV